MSRGVITLVAFMRWTITKKDALGCVIVKLVLISDMDNKHIQSISACYNQHCVYKAFHME